MSRPRCPLLTVVMITTGVFICGGRSQADEKVYWSTGAKWPEPKVVDPGKDHGPPSDAIVLFDGKDLSAWNGAETWKVQDGYVTCGTADLKSKQSFGDCQLHIEWFEPADIQGKSQGRGNSGVFLMSIYEVQILESSQGENKTYVDGQAGAIYKQRPPLVNASRKPGEWQTYDIVFRGPRFDAKGKLLKPAYMTVFHNGVLIQDHFELLGHTNFRKPPRYDRTPEKMPLRIQYHRAPIRFRNIWIRELEDDHGELLTPFREKLKAAAATQP